MNQKNKKKLENGLTELWTRDIEQLLLNKEYDQAKGAMKYFGFSQKIINETISEFKELVNDR